VTPVCTHRLKSMSTPAMQRRIRKIMRVDKMESLILVSLINTQPETGTPRHCIRGCLNVCGAPIRWHRKFLGITLGCKVLGETTQLFGHWFVYSFPEALGGENPEGATLFCVDRD